jgi:hypothetical protein
VTTREWVNKNADPPAAKSSPQQREMQEKQQSESGRIFALANASVKQNPSLARDFNGYCEKVCA